MESNTIGKQIAARRKALGLSTRNLATLAGIDYSNLGKIERGTYNASIAIIDKIAAALNCTLVLEDNKQVTATAAK